MEQQPNLSKNQMHRVNSSRNDFQFQSYPLEEQIAYVKVINTLFLSDASTIFPINPETEDIFTVLADGIVLCKLINKISEGTIPEKDISKSTFPVFKNLNIQRAIDESKKLGCQDVNIGPFSFERKEKIPILAFLWQLIKKIMIDSINFEKYPEMLKLLTEDEKANMNKNGVTPEKLLLRWFNYHLKKDKSGISVNRFDCDEIKNANGYIVLFNKLNGKVCKKKSLKKKM